MKKRFGKTLTALLAACLAVSLILTGCSSADSVKAGSTDPAATQSTVSGELSGGSSADAALPGEQPVSRPENTLPVDAGEEAPQGEAGTLPPDANAPQPPAAEGTEGVQVPSAPEGQMPTPPEQGTFTDEQSQMPGMNGGTFPADRAGCLV